MTPSPPEDLWGFLPKPLAVVLISIVAIAWVVSDVAGKLGKLGFVSKLLDRRQARQEQQKVGWRQRDEEVRSLRAALEAEREEKDRRVEELERTLELVNRQVGYLSERDERRDRELFFLHRLSDARDRAIRAHEAWDRMWAAKAREAGIDVPDPPPLYVDLVEEQ